MPTPYDQHGFERRFGWGRRAARDAAERGDVIVIVDVLSFSTCVAAAVHHGAVVHPFEHKDREAAQAYATEVGAILKTNESGARRALSPLGFTSADEGRAYVLPSPNGSACSRVAADAPAVFAGALVNASAVARAAAACQTPITVVACGEQWREAEEGENVLRPALEDALGAGAILTGLGGALSPEAQVCARAFEASARDFGDLVWDCASGRELRDIGYEDDVRFSAGLDTLGVVPRLVNGAYTAAS